MAFAERTAEHKLDRPPRIIETATLSETARRASRLLDPRAIVRACASDPDVFDALRDAFRRALPDHMDHVRSALAGRDMPGLARAAHKLFGTLGAFSTVGGAVALTIEDAAKSKDFESCVELVVQLDAMCTEVLEDTRDLRLDDLSL